jgi:F5/8 type C domain
MSTYTSEPGTLVAGRYRLVDQASAGTGWVYWKATDETLARSVSVLTFAAGFSRTGEAVAAARTASRLNEPRFSQVFDVEDADDTAYVVSEWVVGESLLDMLTDGPLDSPRAVSLVHEAAQALAVAHAGGLAHLRLNPACVYWTPGGGVKITGLAVDAVLTDGPSSPEGGDADLTDTRDLARLLYAALTGYWPAPHGTAAAAEPAGDYEPGPRLLPPAPETDGAPCTPRQVSAAVPANIDALTCQALFQRPSRHGPALSTPAMLADALAEVVPPRFLPVVAASTAPARVLAGSDYGPNGPTNPYPSAGLGRSGNGGGRWRPPGDRSSAATVLVSAVIVVLLAAVGVAGWSISHRTHPGPAGASSGASSSSSPSAAASALLTPVSANSFDVYGDDGGNENGGEAQYAIDDKPGTFWHTDFYYNYPAFGNLKKGTGLIIDMGKQVRLSQVAVQFGTVCCAHVEIEVGNDNSPVPSSLATFTQVQGSNAAVGVMTFRVTSKATGRYVLIWITDLPRLAGSANEYEAQIYNVVVRGSAVSQSG